MQRDVSLQTQNKNKTDKNALSYWLNGTTHAKSKKRVKTTRCIQTPDSTLIGTGELWSDVTEMELFDHISQWWI